MKPAAEPPNPPPTAPDERLPIIRVDSRRRSLRFQSAERGVALYANRLVVFHQRRWSWIFANAALALVLAAPVLIFVFAWLVRFYD